MIINGHTDIITDITNKHILGEGDIFKKYHYENFKIGKVGIAIFVIWVEPYNNNIEERRLDIINCLEQELLESEVLNHCKSLEDLVDGKINMILSFEGLGHIKNLYEIKRYKEELGIFYASLTWNEKNQFASGNDSDSGITELGEQCIRELEKNNIILDLSHLNEKSFYEAIEISKNPIIASHSNSRHICDNRRNLTNDQIIQIKRKDGLIGINSYGEFVFKNPEKRNILALIEHIKHIRDLIGIEYITFGFDFCDYIEGFTDIDGNTAIENLSSERDVNNLLKGLYNEGFSDYEIQLMCRENYLRFLNKRFKNK